MESTATKADVDTRHETIEKNIQDCINRGEEFIFMGDLNSAINEELPERTYTVRKVLDLEAERKVTKLYQQGSVDSYY